MSGETVLVTGGAGYVGSHACLALAEAGYRPVVFDNLSAGHEDLVRWSPLETGDIRDREAVAAALARWSPAAILHFAARADVAESVREPEAYHHNNVLGAEVLLDAAAAAGVTRVIFSSSCAVYGAPVRTPMDENHPRRPVNPYGAGKLAVERMLASRELADRSFRHISLRYFNAIGAEAEARIGERHAPETHIVPLALRATLVGDRPFRIFGDDYPTRDGTAERDYVHVMDLADAHVLALRRLLGGGASGVYNLGTGRGVTVRELVAEVEAVTGRGLDPEVAERRPGDPPVLLADIGRARAELGWSPRRSLADALASAARWHELDWARD